ncbi:hypothetical protein [Bacillus sp. V59.32b]|uniref:hypothetical protein n=1 Tax=Bacillus sp. V59.32b TaxID=1758642 RepID=UPI000E3C1A86|nr:hypothetical protein [Bacillus sp. V59.32b]RFU64465.1 hypothetical protein D0463_10135 [Bacillus sp. V59.32b]
MPLPLIPLIVAGAAAASAAVAGKKGYDSYQNMKETKELAEELESKYKKAYKSFETGRDETNKTFENYGSLKLGILDGTMKQFVENFKQIKNVNFKGEAVTDKFVSNSEIEQFVLNVEKQVVKAGQVMTAGIASLAGGGLAAMGAVGATTTFAAATTGTAIATLSGIAAQNATLAFLGGGSLAAGGLGVAGGTLVLGGIALAPALAIGSLIFAASTEKKLEEMYAKKAEVNTEVQKLKSATAVMTQITSTTKSMQELAQSTNKLLIANIGKIVEIINQRGNDFRNYSTEEQVIIHNNYKLAIIMRDILNTTILDEKGELVPNLQSVITAEKQKISAI